MNKRPKGTAADDEEMTPSNLRPTVRKEASNEKTPLKREKIDPLQEFVPMEKRKSKRLNEPAVIGKRPSAFTPVRLDATRLDSIGRTFLVSSSGHAERIYRTDATSTAAFTRLSRRSDVVVSRTFVVELVDVFLVLVLVLVR